MKILFNESGWIYYINDANNLTHRMVLDVDDLTDVKDIETLDILYHYRNDSDQMLPVYYEHGNKIITKRAKNFYINLIRKGYKKDYTLVNLELLEEGRDE